MIRLVLLGAFLSVCATSSYAQDLSLMYGTWVNAKFMEGLKRSHSVAWAMQFVSRNAPLWVTVDSANSKVACFLAYDFHQTDTVKIFQANLGELGQRWAMGEAGNPHWMMTPDIQYGQYIALNLLDSLESNPVVMGKLPSRNTDPDFLLQRMITSSYVTGTWKDSAGTEVVFNTNATVIWNGKRRTIGMIVNTPTYQVVMTLTDSRNKKERFSIERSSDKLLLTDENGKQQTLTLQS